MSPTLGLYFDFRNPEPWRRDPAAYYGWHLDLIEEADRRGIGSVWVTEHHFVEDGYLPQPLTALAAIAGRTRQCRLGTGVVVAPRVTIGRGVMVGANSVVTTDLPDGCVAAGAPARVLKSSSDLPES